MKKAILLLVIFVVSFYSFSQDTRYGVRVGYNISNLDFDELPGIKNNHRNGFAIGFLGEFGLSDAISLAPEIQFSAEGAKHKSLRVDYIQAPILIKFILNDKFSIGAGPLVGVKVHEFEDGYKNFAISGIGGIEYMISDEIFVDARYSYGLSNIFDDETGLDAKNTNIQIGFGIKI